MDNLLSLDELKNILLKDEIRQTMHVAVIWKYPATNHLMRLLVYIIQ
jgi:ADP-ribose pyrophosphatase